MKIPTIVKEFTGENNIDVESDVKILHITRENVPIRSLKIKEESVIIDNLTWTTSSRDKSA